MTITINGTDGITTPEVTLDNTSADGGQVVLKSSGYSNWNLDNYSGRIRAYYGSTEYFTINSSGNVGIGTSSPTNISGYTGLAINNGTNGSLIDLRAGGTLYSRWVATSSQAAISTEAAIPLVFQTNATERARIDSSGNLLVGITSSTDIAGTTNAGFLYKNKQLQLTSTGTVAYITAASSGSQTYISFYSQSTSTGSISTNGTTTTYSTTSDYRLKENIAPMTGALAKVAALKPVTYTWKQTGSADEGFIAHELQEVCPSAVTGAKDAVDENGNPVYQGIDTSFLVATLTAAIQELKAIVDEQAAKITALENK